MSTKEGQLMTLNLLTSRAPKPLTLIPFDYRDQSEDHLDDNRKGATKLENRLKHTSINHYYYDKGTLTLPLPPILSLFRK